MADDEESSEDTSDITGLSTVVDQELSLAAKIATGSFASEAIQPAGFQAMAQTQSIVSGVASRVLANEAARMGSIATEVITSGVMDDILRSQQVAMDAYWATDILETHSIAQASVMGPAVESIIKSQEMANIYTPTAAQIMGEIDKSLVASLSTIGSPSFQAGLSAPPPVQPSEEPVPSTEVDASTETPEQTNNPGPTWYRTKALQTAIMLVDYMFWRAHQSGEFTDASESEITMSAIFSAFAITLYLTGNPGEALAWATGSGLVSGTVQQSAQDRVERKNLDDKFGGRQ